MAYFYSVVTKTTQDRQESNADEHSRALNAYIQSPGANGKAREVHEMSTVQTLIGTNLITTTFLCCDEDKDEE